MSGGEVIEGFLCPLCMKDLGDVIQLQVHFDEAHSKEDQAFVQTFKELFGKAKRILADDPDTGGGAQGLQEPVARLRLAPSEDDDSHPVSGIRRDLHPGIPPDQQSGKSHMAEFRKIRSSRVDRYATETNRLIVRLDKLLTGLPGEAGRRREHEKAVVAWVDEDLVKLCPSCARAFNIARRKHHCRLCGSVMCQDCSQFVDFNLCRRLINPSSLASYKGERPGWNLAVSRGQSDSRSEAGGRRSSGLFKLRRSGSRESLGSAMIGGVMADQRLKEEFRCCGYCKSLLSHRDLLMELASSEPIIAQFYSKLREYIRQGEEMNPQYLAMYDSLMSGETNYHSSDVKTLRVKLLKVAENIDLMSKKIQALGVDSSPEVQEGMAKPRRFALQDQVRRASINFIKETLVGLPSLPSDDELLKIQERRKMEIARQLEENRRRREEAQAKYQAMQEKKKFEADKTKSSSLPRSGSGGKFNRSKVSYESGFVLSSSAQQREVVTEVTDDPMLQQIQIITGYIAQARQQNRFDEVHMLETNLNMLKEEFNRQREFQQASSSEQDSSQESTSYVSFQNGDDRPDQNPFKSDDSDDEYDASGKNPFAE